MIEESITYIFAPKTEENIKNFQNECYLFELSTKKIVDKNILVTTEYNFKNVLKKEYTKYLATIIIKGK